MNKDHQHSEDFLKDLTKGKNPFKTPENYFDDLSDKLAVDIFEQSLPKTSGFKAPENYLENFKVKKPQSKIRVLLPYLSTAAAILIGFFIFNNNNNQPSLDQLSREDIISYLSTDEDVETSFLLNNTTINTDNILYSSLENVDINIDEIDAELSEYDIINY